MPSSLSSEVCNLPPDELDSSACGGADFDSDVSAGFDSDGFCLSDSEGEGSGDALSSFGSSLLASFLPPASSIEKSLNASTSDASSTMTAIGWYFVNFFC